MDQAYSTIGKDFRSIMPHSYSCDMVGNHGLRSGRLIRNSDLRKNGQLARKGDIFLRVRTPYDWVHTGLVLEIDGDWMHTIEGNTNDEGLREGFEVCQRMRNFKRENLDVFKVDFPQS